MSPDETYLLKYEIKRKESKKAFNETPVDGI